jgi:hypothetical protein
MSARPAAFPSDQSETRASFPHRAALFSAYAAVTGCAAVVLGEAMAAAISPVLPVALTRTVAVTALVVSAGAGQKRMCTRIVRRLWPAVA